MFNYSSGCSVVPTIPINPDWEQIVAEIRGGSREAVAELYRIVSKGLRVLLCRKLGMRNLDDKVHDTFLAVVGAIQRGEIREPARLMGFIRTVADRQAVAEIRANIRLRLQTFELDTIVTFVRDPARDPEQLALHRERVAIAARILTLLPSRQRDILQRFYVQEQPPDVICSEMGLTTTQFRLLKSRAKARFADVGARKLHRRAAMAGAA